MLESLEEQRTTGMCPHGNFPNRCSSCREEQSNILRSWLDTLPDHKRWVVQQAWSQILESISHGDDAAARNIFDSLDVEFPIPNEEVWDLAKSTSVTVADFWTDPEAARGYSEAASEDDGGLMQLEKLTEQHPEFFELKNGACVLELGSGTGLALRKIRSYFPKDVQIFGLDISEAMHENNLEKETYAGFEIGDLSDGLAKTHKEKQFELVLAAGVFQYLRPDALQKIFTELAEVSKESARVVFSIGSRDGFGDWNPHTEIQGSDSQPVGIVVRDLGVPMYYYSDEFIDALVRKNGFTVESDEKFTLSQKGDSLETSQPSRFLVVRKVDMKNKGVN